MADGAEEGVFGARRFLRLDGLGLLANGQPLLTEHDQGDGDQRDHREHDDHQPIENNVPFLDVILIGGGALLHLGVVGQVGHFDGVRLDGPHGRGNLAEVDFPTAQQLIDAIHLQAHLFDHFRVARLGVQRLGRFGDGFQHVKTRIEDFEPQPQVVVVHLRGVALLLDQRVELRQLDGELGD